MQLKNFIWPVTLIIITAIVYLIVRFNNGSHRADEQEPVKCTAKTVYRYKYPSEMFPVIIHDYSTNFQLTSGVLSNIAGDSTGNVTVGVDVRNTARQLRDTLNQDNIFFEDALKSYFFESNNDPCNEALHLRYAGFIEEMFNKVVQMKQFIAGVTTAPPTTANPPKKDSIIAVIDTAKSTVDSTSKTIKTDKLLLLKDEKKINSAFQNIKLNYVISKQAKALKTN